MKTGRPSKYNPEFNEQVYKLALLGATDKEIAEFFNVTEQTINNWKESEPEFFESLKGGKIKADAEVSNSLLKRANGYKYEEVKTEVMPDGSKRITTTLKEVPPDVAAQNIWLKNRRGRIKDELGQRWADKHEVDHTTKGDKISLIPTKEEIKDISDALENEC